MIDLGGVDYAKSIQLRGVSDEDKKIDAKDFCFEGLSVSAGEFVDQTPEIFTWKGTSFEGSSGGIVLDQHGKLIGLQTGYISDI